MGVWILMLTISQKRPLPQTEKVRIFRKGAKEIVFLSCPGNFNLLSNLKTPRVDNF